MFSTLFGGAWGEASSEVSLTGRSLMATMMSADSVDENSFDEQTSDDLMASIASLHAGCALKQKIAGLQGDGLDDELKLEQAETSLDSENSDAVALATSGILFPTTQGGTSAMPNPSVAGLANIIFEDGVGPNASTGSALASDVSKNPALVDKHNSLEQNKASTELIGSQQLRNNSAKVVKDLVVNMENPLTKSMTSDIAKLQALRAANSEQQNADLDEEATKADLAEFNGKSAKNGLTVAGLKQMMISTANSPLTAKMASFGEGGRSSNDVTRLATASSNTFDNAPATTLTSVNGSSTGQSGGQTGQQSGSQSGSQSGGGLLGSLNNLQILDTAKDNWTEMLLQRVKNGLSGGKDHLDFQLNPRNLGKMRISLIMQNDRTNIQIQTETSAAASMLSDSESRLAQMLEASGLRLGNLSSGHFQGFGSAGSDQQTNQQGHSKTGAQNHPDDVQGEGEVVEELVTEESDNLINIQA